MSNSNPPKLVQVQAAASPKSSSRAKKAAPPESSSSSSSSSDSSSDSELAPLSGLPPVAAKKKSYEVAHDESEIVTFHEHADSRRPSMVGAPHGTFLPPATGAKPSILPPLNGAHKTASTAPVLLHPISTQHEEKQSTMSPAPQSVTSIKSPSDPQSEDKVTIRLPPTAEGDSQTPVKSSVSAAANPLTPAIEERKEQRKLSTSRSHSVSVSKKLGDRQPSQSKNKKGGDGDAGQSLLTYRINNQEDVAAGKFVTNFIKTSKYTIITFLPLNLFNQFMRLANAYFLFVVLLQTIPGVSPFPIYTSLAPLIFILAIGALNEAREDYYRHKADAIANSRPSLLLKAPTGEMEQITSAVVKVGEILRIEEGQEFPADLILLHTSKEDGTSYVNTANLDGEAAPKIRAASGATQNTYNTPEKLKTLLNGRIQYERPNASLYRFQGNVMLPDPVTGVETLFPLGDKQLLLRGARLVNTEYIYGLVVYTGVETKMMLNRNPARYKFSHFEQGLNRCVVVCLLLNLLICLIPSLFYMFTNLDFAKYWDIDESDGKGWLLGFITLYILFSFMVPQSLYVTIELVKVGQAKFMEWDNAMGYVDPDTGEYSRCQVKASALNEELGAVDVICTDKTGTLTSNQMDLSRCTVGGALFFENDTHRNNHILNNPQTEIQRKRYGTHKLMKDLVASGMHGWIAKTADESGPMTFNNDGDFITMDQAMKAPSDDEHHPEEKKEQQQQHYNSVDANVPSKQRMARDFLLNILLCNAVLPSWKTPGKDTAAHAPDSITHPHSAEAEASLVVKPNNFPPSDPAENPHVTDEISRPHSESATGRHRSPSIDAPNKPAKEDRSTVGKKLVFESQSPDEIALLQALQRVGLTLSQRSGNNLRFDIDVPEVMADHPNNRKLAAASALGSLSNSKQTSPLISPKSSEQSVVDPSASPVVALSSSPADVSSRVSLTYTVLAQLEFSSAWRRTSVIVRGPDNEIMLYTKGADSTIAQLIDMNDPFQSELTHLIMSQVTMFAGTGSRTLCFSSKKLTQEQFDEWFPLFDAAQNALSDRDNKIERAFAVIEQKMNMLGCSAVDDQLQENVAETVDFLLGSQLQIIVLTGDKKETGVQIAREAHLVPSGAHVLYVEGITSAEVADRLSQVLRDMESIQNDAKFVNPSEGRNRNATVSSVHHPTENGRDRTASVEMEEHHQHLPNHIASPANSQEGAVKQLRNRADSRARVQQMNGDLLYEDPNGKKLTVTVSNANANAAVSDIGEPVAAKIGFVLAIDGVALEIALTKHQPLFQQIFARLETVVSYRSTPMQKALVVKMMKGTGKVVLAIGDGANDVSMIQESHVGIGILGKEGAHAAMSSDFVIKRFRHLRRLLCVHGRNNFFRTTQVVMFSFYKNLAYPLPLFWFCFYSMANGTTSFDSLLMTLFNTFFTSLPPFFAGLFDRDVHDSILMNSPSAFPAFKAQNPFTVRSFVYTLVSATYQSAVTYFIAHFMFLGTDVININGRAEGMAVMGNMMMTSVVLTTNLSMLLSLSSPNYVSLIAMGIGFLLYMGVFIFESASYQYSLAPDGFGVGPPIFGAVYCWLYLIFTCVLCLLPNAAIECWLKLYRPLYFQMLQSLPHETVVESRQEKEQAIRQAKEDKVKQEKAALERALSSSQRGRRKALLGAGRSNSASNLIANNSNVEMANMELPPPAHTLPLANAIPRIEAKNQPSAPANEPAAASSPAATDNV